MSDPTEKSQCISADNATKWYHAWINGIRADLEGYKISDNPFVPSSDLWRAWNEGFYR